MKINALIRTLCFGAALSAGSLFANTVVLTDTANDGDFNGGEFKATTDSSWTFFTFCLEHGVSVNLGTTYNYTLHNSTAFGGGYDPRNSTPGDPISKGTAWLFEAFYKGYLVDTDGVGTYFDAGTHGGLSARDYNAGQLQKAIWHLEDEIVDPTNFYVQLVEGIFGAAAAYTNYTGSDVQVMNLWAIGTGDDVQSQLVFVPDNGMTAALLGLGLLSLAAFRRKL